MHYTFTSRAAGDLIMMGPVGDSILRIIGKTPADKGILPASDLPAAIAAIHAAIAQAESVPEQPVEATPHASPEAVSLRQHAWPFVDMLKLAQTSGEAITWGV